MALTYTPLAQMGFQLPTFELPSVDGRIFSHRDFAKCKALVVMFICNHCPYVKAIEDRLIALVAELVKLNVSVVGICSNDPTDYPEDSPAELLKRWKEKNYGFPYLVDKDQSVAKAFGAVCTPDFFVFDGQGQLQYRGRLDDSWKNESLVKNQELKQAVLNLVAGKQVNSEQNSSMGCSIKWKNHD